MVDQTNIFVGFSTDRNPTEIFDEELIIIDLLNHFKTRRGERVMNPEFGTIIWDLLFEHKSDFIRNEIERDVIRIIESDPRVSLQQLEITEQEYGYIVQAQLFFVEFDQVRTLAIDFNQNLLEETTAGIN